MQAPDDHNRKKRRFFYEEPGIVRVVPARELSLEEIRIMKEETGLEVECFVHGALCYCYSASAS